MITCSYIPDCIHTAGFRFHIDPDWIHSFGYEMSDWRLSVLDRPHILFWCIYALDTRIVVEVRILIELTTARTLRCRIAVSSLSFLSSSSVLALPRLFPVRSFLVPVLGLCLSWFRTKQD
jgi:hypothetical protein